MATENYAKSIMRPAGIEGRVIENQKMGRLEIYDSDGVTSMWIGFCGEAPDGTPMHGTLTFGTDGVRQVFTGIYGNAPDGNPISGTVIFDADGIMQVLTGRYGELAAGMLVFNSSGVPIFHSGYQAGGY